MNDYPLWWDTTLTIYNKYVTNTDLVKWYRFTVNNCFWKYVGDKVIVGSTTLETNNIICRIPENPAFLENYKWNELTADVKAQGIYFTLSQGDIIVKGKVFDEIDEYEKGHRSTDLLAKYKKLQGCMEVDTFAINTGGGRNEPHYYVKGI